MTAAQIIQRIEAAGGVLAVNEDRIRYELPEEAAPLIDLLREHRDEVLHVLRRRQETVKQQVSRWLGARCVRTQRAWAAEKFLYRDYLEWSRRYRQSPCSWELFAQVLSGSLPREEGGWQGLCLTLDFAAATSPRTQ